MQTQKILQGNISFLISNGSALADPLNRKNLHNQAEYKHFYYLNFEGNYAKPMHITLWNGLFVVTNSKVVEKHVIY